MPENLAAYSPIPRLLQPVYHSLAWKDLGRVFRRADVVTAPTPRAVELLVGRAGLPDAFPVSCGIDVERYLTEVDPGPVPTVLFVGRMDQEKRVDELIRAFAALPAGLPARLEIVGDGGRRGDWTALAAELGLADRVTVPRVRLRAGAAGRVRPGRGVLHAGDRRAAEHRHPGGDGRRHPGRRRRRDGAAAPGPPRPQRLAVPARGRGRAEHPAGGAADRPGAAPADGRGQPGAGRRARLRRHPGPVRGHLPAGPRAADDLAGPAAPRSSPPSAAGRPGERGISVERRVRSSRASRIRAEASQV